MSRRKISPLTADYTPVHPKEYFHLMFQSWNVAQAWRLVQGWTPGQRAERFGKIALPLGWLDQVVINVPLAESDKVDLDVPLIVGLFPKRDGRYGTMVLDGWHRVYKAHQMRKRKLAAFFLTAEETKALEVR